MDKPAPPVLVDDNHPTADEQKSKKKKKLKLKVKIKFPKGRSPSDLLKKRHKPRWNVYPVIDINQREHNATKRFPSNKISTTKYTLWNFLPKNLFEQFRRLTNFYFLVITALTLVPQISPLTPVTSILPLVFVLGVTAIKEAFEDYKRYVADKKVNDAAYKVLQPDGTKKIVASKDLRVGDILLVESNQFFPADLVLLTSALDDGVCYIETSQLDGESNLKILRALPQTAKLTEQDICKFTGKIACEAPHPNLYIFNANITMPDEQVHSIDVKQLLLRGAKLRNTSWVYAIIVATGVDTKLSLNQRQPPSKFSTLEKRMNTVVLGVFLFKLTCAILAGIIGAVYQSQLFTGAWYLEQYADENIGATAGLDFISYFILLSFLIPMSMMVTLEIVKVVQVQWMQWDEQMMTDKNDPESGMSAKTSNLNDELALVKYIFSDKTGTLTQNVMEFNKCSIAGRSYDNPAKGELKTILEKYNWTPSAETKRETSKDAEPIAEFFRALAVCQTAVPEVDDNNQVTYQAQSPDEVALCKAAQVNGFTFSDRKTASVTVNEFGVDRVYQVLNVLEFSSDRARMSVIARTPEGKIMVYSKGADSRMIPLLDDTDEALMQDTTKHLEAFSKEGLRTLVVASRELSEFDYAKWNAKYQKAAAEIDDRVKKVAHVSAKIEKKLKLIGCTAIEDKLQDGVPTTIKYLLEAGIKIWVITGDKQETAINIGFSTNLLKPELPLVIINATTDAECQERLTEAIKGYKNKNTPIGLVIDGASLIFALATHSALLLELSKMASSVVCCRVTPLQKAQIVLMVKRDSGDTCLAIGDGANDVSMIQAAHIGIGIFGKEGTQAARASDYAIQQFSHLRVLLTHHGRYAMVRNAALVQSSFYKNMAFFLTQFWFGFWNGFTAQTLYDDWVVTCFNIVMTSLPPLFLGCFEKDITEGIIDKNPTVFKVIQSGESFTYKSLSRWLASALYHSLVFWFFPFCLYLNAEFMLHGRASDLRSMGFLASTAAVLAIIAKIALETQYWTWFAFLGYGLSLLGYALLLIILAYMPENWPQAFEVMPNLATAPAFWLAVALILVVCIFPEMIDKYWRWNYRPEQWKILKELQLTKGFIFAEDMIVIKTEEPPTKK